MVILYTDIAKTGIIGRLVFQLAVWAGKKCPLAPPFPGLPGGKGRGGVRVIFFYNDRFSWYFVLVLYTLKFRPSLPAGKLFLSEVEGGQEERVGGEDLYLFMLHLFPSRNFLVL